jgi:hypothetical protein
MAIAALYDLELIQLYVTTGFLNGDIDEEIYITQPEGYVIPDAKQRYANSTNLCAAFDKRHKYGISKLNSLLIAAGL